MFTKQKEHELSNVLKYYAHSKWSSDGRKVLIPFLVSVHVHVVFALSVLCKYMYTESVLCFIHTPGKKGIHPIHICPVSVPHFLYPYYTRGAL